MLAFDIPTPHPCLLHHRLRLDRLYNTKMSKVKPRVYF